MVFSKIKAWLMLIGGVLLTISAIFLRGKSAGKQQAEAKTNETILKQTEEVQEIIHRVGNLSDNQRKRLRKKYTRD